MHRDYERRSFPGAMPNSDSPCPPPSPPPPSPSPSPSPSPTRPLSPRHVPSSPIRQNAHRSESPSISPSLVLLPQPIRPLSPQLTLPANALIRPSTSQSLRTLPPSVSIMPPIREDPNSISSDVFQAAHQRSRSSVVYQYGEDYITAYDRVGLTASPGPRCASRASARSTSSLQRSASVRSAMSAKSEKSASSLRWSIHSARTGSSNNKVSEAMLGQLETERAERARQRGLENSPASEPESEREKWHLTQAQPKISLWRRWRRLFMILLAVLGLAGLAVGIIFGTRSQ